MLRVDFATNRNSAVRQKPAPEVREGVLVALFPNEPDQLPLNRGAVLSCSSIAVANLYTTGEQRIEPRYWPRAEVQLSTNLNWTFNTGFGPATQATGIGLAKTYLRCERTPLLVTLSFATAAAE